MNKKRISSNSSSLSKPGEPERSRSRILRGWSWEPELDVHAWKEPKTPLSTSAPDFFWSGSASILGATL